MRIIHEKEKCIGCGSCAMLCPKYWEMGEDGKAHLLNSKIDKKTENWILEIKKSECNKEAADVCPVACIKITK
ncbi:MAG: ferredoxin [Candidatus Pacebacteria bacterium]|nr:ferredoxin [Candidatus Paceibacterota bacterium]